MELLEVKNLSVSYSGLKVVRDISLSVSENSITSLIGANGAGKTTTLKAIAGAIRIQEGGFFFRGEKINEFSSHQRVLIGISLIPEGGRIFPYMSVKENLDIGAYVVKEKKIFQRTLNWVFTLFPRLSERKRQMGSSLSGGERQMLAIARALMANPSLLMMDEPSMGLAPNLVDLIFEVMRQIVREGKTVFLVEQNIGNALEIANRAYVLETGQVVLQGHGRELLINPHVKKAYLGM